MKTAKIECWQLYSFWSSNSKHYTLLMFQMNSFWRNHMLLDCVSRHFLHHKGNFMKVSLIDWISSNVLTFWMASTAFSVVSLVPFNFNIGTIGHYWSIIWQINSERYILPMATYLPIVPMTYQWLAYWPMVIYMDL